MTKRHIYPVFVFSFTFSMVANAEWDDFIFGEWLYLSKPCHSLGEFVAIRGTREQYSKIETLLRQVSIQQSCACQRKAYSGSYGFEPGDPRGDDGPTTLLNDDKLISCLTQP